MIDVKPIIECDLSMSAIEHNIHLLRDYRPFTSRVFFIVFTPEYRIFSRELERYQQHGYDAVFYQPKVDLPNACAWDFVMYDTRTGEAIARLQNRPVS